MGQPRTPRPGRALLADVLLAAAAASLLAVCLVVIPVGIVAASVLDQAGSWRSALGDASPLAYRVFQAERAWLPRAAPFALLAVVLHCLLRRWRRPEVAFGDDLAWDGLLSPISTAAAAAAIGSITLAATTRQLPDADALAFVAWAAAGLAAALGAISLAAGLFLRLKAMRILAAVGVSLLVALSLVRLGADAWGKARLAAYGRAVDADLLAERQRMAAARSPLLRGVPLEEDAMPRYRALSLRVSTMKYEPDLQAITKAARAGPSSPLDPLVRRVLEENRDAVLGLREAVRCTRSVGELRMTRPNEAIPSLLSWRILGTLLTVEGHERALAGDAAGAAERYLDVVRFGGDVRDGPLINGLISLAVEEMGLQALDALLVSDLRPPLRQVEAELGKLEGHGPSAAHTFRQERLYVLGGCTLVEKPEDMFDTAAPVPLLIPYRLLLASAVATADPHWRALERGEKVPATGPTWNPAFRMISPETVERARLTLRLLEARFALSRALLGLETLRSASGTYPADPAGLSLPEDPMASGKPLRYEASADRRGYKIWSVGLNERDDGGASQEQADLVVERN